MMTRWAALAPALASTLALGTALSLSMNGTAFAADAGRPASGAESVTVDLTRPDWVAFRNLYQQLVQTNTTLSSGSCTAAAQAVANRLTAIGLKKSDVRVLVPEGRPKDGALAAVLPGSDPAAKPLLLLAHIDVVEAKREDWQRDPFTLVEENGYFYGRGSSDDKAMAAVFADLLVRLRQEGFRPKRTIKLALTCGEETSDTFDGVQYLLAHDRDALDAEFALNEGAGGRLDKDGKYLALEIQAGEKVYQDFTLETTNPGGHSSRPSKDNAIYHLAAGLNRLAAFDFPVALNPVTKAYFTALSPVIGGAVGADMIAITKDNPDPAAIARVSQDPGWNSTLRTTCVATMVTAGHAPNALPQHAQANVNCRILPGQPLEEVRQTLVKVLDDPAIKVTAVGQPSPVSPPPALTPTVLDPVTEVAAKMWPGVPVVPTMSTGATDGRFLNAAGIATYGLSGMFRDPDGSGVHGLNERIRVRSLYEGREFLYAVVKKYAG
ncbi:M20/M25/M40 family metallo-hydrolase [Nitrospirillum sp. BR 11828]|uniref:M20/M25/M40 family metallo-hydrolase n=1 Tax=Nitrospirillum sp. BR 11828 TaxID=3104325 RepID=UPI002ACA1F39|nr:M20/M25/M40 family metallo-hydrolase [Nitrospirillum sp. BR 11828]MDZ5650596.1 M20/M25/M40 family metallo-hydrolase [Nitrospirillum sp. BR 11828]